MTQNNARGPGVLFLTVLLCAVVLEGLAGRAWPAETTSPAEESYENVLGMKFVPIPIGEFWMGSPASEPSRKDNELQHRVRITKPFLLAIHEVTVGQFRTFVDATGYRTDAEGSEPKASGWNRNSLEFDRHRNYNWRNPGFDQDDDHPVVNVSWNDSQEFCRWLSRLDKQSHRLPTEAEWEYACRAGTTTPYGSGDDPETLARFGNFADRAARRYWSAAAEGWKFLNSDDGYAFTCPVGKFQANAWGLYDMQGNVKEWCEDRYGADYYRVSPQNDPQGPADGNDRVCRGGNWGSSGGCRVAFRDYGTTDESQRFLGFRVALEPKTALEEQR